MDNPVLKSVEKKYNKGVEEGEPLKYLDEDETKMILDVLNYAVKDLAKIRQKSHKSKPRKKAN